MKSLRIENRVEFDNSYEKLHKAFVSKFGVYSLGVVGKYYLSADGFERSFDLWLAKSDKRCSFGYRLKLVYSTHIPKLMYDYLGLDYDNN